MPFSSLFAYPSFKARPHRLKKSLRADMINRETAEGFNNDILVQEF